MEVRYDIKGRRSRVMARVVFTKRNSILVSEGRNSTKKNRYFIIPGGNVEFGEDSKTTAIREMSEELKSRIKNLRYLGVIENIFDFGKVPYHEIAFIYSAEFANKEMYKKETIGAIEDNGVRFVCSWKKLGDFKNRKYFLVPVGVMELLTKKGMREKHYIPKA